MAFKNIRAKKAKDHIPPKLAQRFLGWFLRDDFAEEVQGDLEEQFYSTLSGSSPFKAKLNYWFQVVNYLRPFAIRRHSSNPAVIYGSYIKIGWKNLTKQKFYSAIKIGGLTLGMAACLLISLFVKYELSFDKHYANGDRIYRVLGVYNIKGEVVRGIYFPSAMASALKDDFSGIEASGRFFGSELNGRGGEMVRRTDKVKNTYEEGFIYADQEFLNLLSRPAVHGDLSRALIEPNTMVISNSKAIKYFPNENPMGKTLLLNDDEMQAYIIRGVFEDFPVNSHFQCDFMLTLSGAESITGDQTSWDRNIYHIYVKLQPETDATQLEPILTRGIVQTYMLSNWQEEGIVDAEEWANDLTLELQPVREIHLQSSWIDDGHVHGDIRMVWLFSTIAVFILVIACINFINLSTAQSANRAKEIGLRKVVGCFRSDLIKQFLIETLLFSFLSFSLAILLAWLLLPYFNALSAKAMAFPWKEWWLIPLFAVAAIIIGVLAGLYPSLYFSDIKPIQVLKGNANRGTKSSMMRSILVIFQFTTSIVLIAGTLIIHRQISFILKKELGFDKELVLLIQGANVIDKQLPAFKSELLKLSQVEHVSASDFIPVDGARRNGNAFWLEGSKEAGSAVDGQTWYVDHDYVKTMGMNIIEGRDFDIKIAGDSQSTIINQTMARDLGLKNPIGKEIIGTGSAKPIIGVIEDFHFDSFTEEIDPLCLVIRSHGSSVISVKINASVMFQAIEAVASVWSSFVPSESFRYDFLDDQFTRTYADVQRTGSIFTIFAALAIIIACLGLFAFSSYMFEQRRKEISIRLIMGASLSDIFKLLTRSFLILILVSIFIATPIAWFMIQRWLEDYAYRIQISLDVFLLAGLMALAIGGLTISYQAVNAARMNPVDNLQLE